MGLQFWANKKHKHNNVAFTYVIKTKVRLGRKCKKVYELQVEVVKKYWKSLTSEQLRTMHKLIT